MLRETGKIVTRSAVITNQLSITMAELIIDYLFSSDKPALIENPANLHQQTAKVQTTIYIHTHWSQIAFSFLDLVNEGYGYIFHGK